MRHITEEQMAKVRRGERWYSPIGTKNSNAKLDEEKVREIRSAYGPARGDMRSMHREGPTLEELAFRYGVSKDTIHRVVRGKAWSHVG